MRTVLKLILLCFLFFNVQACGKEEVKADSRLSTPAKTYKLWLDLAVEGDLVASLDCVTEESKHFIDQQAKLRDVFMERLVSNAKEFKKYDISDTKEKEDKAVVLLKGPKEALIVVPFKRDKEGWKVDLIAMFSM